MKNNEFDAQILARGSFLDTENGEMFEVEAATIRLNHVALNAWILSEMHNVQDCYDTDEEWKRHKEEYKEKRKTVVDRIIKIVGIDVTTENQSVNISQSQSEVFTLVRILKLS